MSHQNPVDLSGAAYFPAALDQAAQSALVEDIRAILRVAPLVQPMTPSGKPMSVRMSAAGDYGWVTDRRGYRYQRRHPDGQSWPAIPLSLSSLWQKYSNSDRAPQCCLVNWYGPEARMGLHQDKDEADLTQPVLSISLGDEARFRIGGVNRSDPTRSVWLKSGDIVVLQGLSRLAYHGIDKIRAGSSSLLQSPGRINLTLRVVD
jgi:alkylated DNA repair protein (DNA oxidative demethylase)